ncbi:MAG: T9SS type A sorting domain-containing protein [Sphingobacteriales bacterium]|nr:T9SS type A sorting domain-containing protein [Sphingobacteriales bacterium]
MRNHAILLSRKRLLFFPSLSLIVSSLFFFPGFVMHAQSGAPCYTPMAGFGKTATPVENGLLCAGCSFVSDINNVTDASTTNYATYVRALGLLAENGISVADNSVTYPSGWIAGYVIDLGNEALSADVLNSFRLETWNNGVRQEFKTGLANIRVTLLSGGTGKAYLSFKTTADFDEVRFIFNAVVAVTQDYRIYYAMAFAPDCGTSFTASYCYKQISGVVNFNGGLVNALVTLTNPANISDGNKTTYGTFTVPIGTPLLSEPVYAGVMDEQLVYPAGNKAGFMIGYTPSLLTADVLNSLSIATYLHGELQESVLLGTGGAGVNLSALSTAGTERQEVSITTTKTFNEIRLVTDNTLGINVNAIKIYYAFESAPACTDCSMPLVAGQASPYTGSLQASRTGTFGAICLGQSLSGTANVVDANLANYASYTPALLSVGCGGRIAVKNDGVDLPANTFAGFVVAREATLLDLGILDAITINLYKDDNGTPVQSATGAGLLDLGLLNPSSGKTFIGIKSTVAFDEVQIVFDDGLINATIGGTFRIYNAYVIRDDDNDGVADCVEVCGAGNDAIDTDSDGLPDACDGCSVVSSKSSVLDRDGDGISNACDADSDNDGIADAVEDANGDGDFNNDDFDGDGVPNYKDLDSDNDGINDLNESGISAANIAAMDADNNGVIDASVAKGSNGMADAIEVSDDATATNNYTVRDTDGDTHKDFLDLDSDNDGINDIKESGHAAIADANSDGVVDGPDGDFDGIMDSADGNDASFGDAADLFPRDTDGDSVPDFRDLDSDNDAMGDLQESGTPGLTDADNDGVIDGADTDGDGIMNSADGAPAKFGDATDPAVADTDTDGSPNYMDLTSNGVSDDIDSGYRSSMDGDNDGMIDNPSDPEGDGIANNDGLDTKPALFGGIAILYPLPLSAIELSAVADNTLVQLKWVTENEQYCSRFIVERSTDGILFTACAEVQAAGINGANGTYTALDELGAAACRPVVYYLIKAVDNDGDYRHSNIVALRLNPGKLVYIWPNPFESQLNLQVELAANAGLELRIYNTEGRLLLIKKQPGYTGSNIIRVTQKLGRLARGSYLVEVLAGNQKMYSAKLIKL